MLKYVTLMCSCEIELFISDDGEVKVRDGKIISPCPFHSGNEGNEE